MNVKIEIFFYDKDRKKYKETVIKRGKTLCNIIFLGFIVRTKQNHCGNKIAEIRNLHKIPKFESAF